MDTSRKLCFEGIGKMNLLYKRKSRGYEAKKHGRDFRFRGEDLR